MNYEFNPKQLRPRAPQRLAEYALERLMRGDSVEDTREWCRVSILADVQDFFYRKQTKEQPELKFPPPIEEIYAANNRWIDPMAKKAVEAAKDYA